MSSGRRIQSESCCLSRKSCWLVSRHQWAGRGRTRRGSTSRAPRSRIGSRRCLGPRGRRDPDPPPPPAPPPPCSGPGTMRTSGTERGSRTLEGSHVPRRGGSPLRWICKGRTGKWESAQSMMIRSKKGKDEKINKERNGLTQCSRPRSLLFPSPRSPSPPPSSHPLHLQIRPQSRCRRPRRCRS